MLWQVWQQVSKPVVLFQKRWRKQLIPTPKHEQDAAETRSRVRANLVSILTLISYSVHFWLNSVIAGRVMTSFFHWITLRFGPQKRAGGLKWWQYKQMKVGSLILRGRGGGGLVWSLLVIRRVDKSIVTGQYTPCAINIQLHRVHRKTINFSLRAPWYLFRKSPLGLSREVRNVLISRDSSYNVSWGSYSVSHMPIQWTGNEKCIRNFGRERSKYFVGMKNYLH